MRIYLLFIIFLITNCFVSIAQKQISTKLSLSDFENIIKLSMGFDSIISRYGDPSITTGSGISILIYTLIDSTSVTIGCHHKGTVYARYRDKKGNFRDLIYNTTTDQSNIRKKNKRHNKPNKTELGASVPRQK
jgi:hypothetical protein